MRLGRYRIHRSEQWDLGAPTRMPLLVVHRYTDFYRSTRVFCLWFWGVQVGSHYFGKSFR